MKNNNVLIIVTFLMLLFGYTTFEYAKKYFAEKKGKNRLENSIVDAGKALQYYKTKNGQLVAKNNVLQLKYSETKSIYPKIIEEIRNLDIKPRNVHHYTETVLSNEKNIITTIRDSLIYDTIHARVFNYNDPFYTIAGIAVGVTQKVHIKSRDSLIQVVYKGERYNPWLWIFSKRKLQQSILTKNPNSKVEYCRHIEIVK
jgi:hypothetical protein